MAGLLGNDRRVKADPIITDLKCELLLIAGCAHPGVRCLSVTSDVQESFSDQAQKVLMKRGRERKRLRK
jgi:metal-dependent hydrolase (beta-lactamase superfamily II)